MKHVLQEILVFHLMALAMNQDGFLLLEGLCREFVWGPGEQGNPHVPLIAWYTVAQPAVSGGLSVISFREHGKLLKLRCVSQLIREAPTVWVDMASLLIKDDLKAGTHKKERKRWSPREALLLQAKIHTSSSIVNFILQNWSAVENRIQFEPSADTVPLQLSILQVLDLMEVAGEGDSQYREDIIAYARVRNIAVVDDLLTGTRWMTEEEVHGHFRCNCFSRIDTLRPMLQFLQNTEGLDQGGRHLAQLKGWGGPPSA